MSLRSFDIFDTLIARRCIDPVAVFHEVERRSGAAGFTALRQAAERIVEAGEYGLADIYRELARLASLEAAAADRLMALELAVELENVIPIADNVAQVEDDSLLITDMYLPESAIRAMLQAAGLPGHLCLLRSAHGKRSGAVWRAFREQGLRSEHLGDHAISDHARPLEAGMGATLTLVAQPTPTERLLRESGLERLARAVRAARLMTPGAGLSADLLRLQVEFNLPLLLITALHLLGETGAVRQLLFSSRDARYLQTVYDAAARALPGRPHAPSAYWHSSRVARLGGDPVYLDYCRRLIGPAALLIDLCGTGASVAALREKLGLPGERAPLFVMEWIDSPQQLQNQSAAYGVAGVKTPFHLWTNRELVANEVLELLNYVPEGMVRGVQAVPGGFVPQREALEFDGETLAQVRTQARFVQAWATALAGLVDEALLDEVRQHLPAARAVMRHVAPGLVEPMRRMMAAWLPQHRAREQVVAAALFGAANA